MSNMAANAWLWQEHRKRLEMLHLRTSLSVTPTGTSGGGDWSGLMMGSRLP